MVSTHSRPKAAGGFDMAGALDEVFQHTAARRRLGKKWMLLSCKKKCFNTQPPEGGWEHFNKATKYVTSFNTQPPEGGWPADSQ